MSWRGMERDGWTINSNTCHVLTQYKIRVRYKLELYHGGAWFMVYTSGAVSIEHEGVARVFYSKQKPRVCTINHKPRHGTTVLYNAIAQGLIWARIVHVAIILQRRATRLHMRERSWALQLGKTLSKLRLRVTQLSRCYLC